MSSLDYAALLLLIGIGAVSTAVLWQMYVVLSESYTLDRYKSSRRMVWIACAVFFSFSLALYYFCPNARKKGMVFFLLGAVGVLCYGLGICLKNRALAGG